jgi:hypothetical protein
MRQDDGWRWLRNSSGIVAALSGLIALPVATAVVVFSVVVPFSLNGCEFSLDLAPTDLGMSVDEAGAITARVPTCHGGGAMALQLLGPDEAVMWRVEASEVHHLQAFTVGVTPEGFTDAVPLADSPLDPAATYDLQLLLVATTSSSSTTTTAAGSTTSASATTPDAPAELLGGARTLFSPADLQPDQLYFGSQSVAPDEFDDAACAEHDAS